MVIFLLDFLPFKCKISNKKKGQYQKKWIKVWYVTDNRKALLWTITKNSYYHKYTNTRKYLFYVLWYLVTVTPKKISKN